jgi:hypothetical protein
MTSSGDLVKTHDKISTYLKFYIQKFEIQEAQSAKSKTKEKGPDL